MFAVLFLMLTESFCEDLRTAKYYYCTTLFVYESMFIMSVLLMTLHQKTLYHTKFSIFTEISFFLTTKLFFFSHWIKNTIVHISLCRWEISGVRKHEKWIQYKCSMVLFPPIEETRKKSV